MSEFIDAANGLFSFLLALCGCAAALFFLCIMALAIMGLREQIMKKINEWEDSKL